MEQFSRIAQTTAGCQSHLNQLRSVVATTSAVQNQQRRAPHEPQGGLPTRHRSPSYVCLPSAVFAPSR